MNYKSSYLTLVVTILLIFASSASAQTYLTGQVVEVLDGKTMIVSANSGRVKVRLDYVDVPEVGQPLNETVRSHLQKLVLGKVVQFRTRLISSDYAIGQVMLNGVDISQQMLRDGAAWHVPATKSGQSESESSVYQYHQAQAKLENRGVWGVKDLKPAWQMQAEMKTRQALEKPGENQSGGSVKQAETALPAVRVAQSKVRNVPLDLDGQMSRDAWVDVTANPYKHDYGVHKISTNMDGTIGLLSTSPEFIYLHSGNSRQKIVCRAVSATRDKPDGNRESIVLLGFQAISETLNLAKNKNSLSIVADGKRIPVFGIVGLSKEEYYGVDERLAYGVSPGNFRKIASAKNVEITIDKYKGKLLPSTLALFKQLSDAM